MSDDIEECLAVVIKALSGDTSIPSGRHAQRAQSSRHHSVCRPLATIFPPLCILTNPNPNVCIWPELSPFRSDAALPSRRHAQGDHRSAALQSNGFDVWDNRWLDSAQLIGHILQGAGNYPLTDDLSLVGNAEDHEAAQAVRQRTDCLRGFGPLAGRSFELRPLGLAPGHDRLEFLEVHSNGPSYHTHLPIGHAIFTGTMVRFLATGERLYLT